jgi:hypothetical protein
LKDWFSFLQNKNNSFVLSAKNRKMSQPTPQLITSLSQEAEVLYKSFSLSKSNTWISLVSSGHLGVPLSWSLVTSNPTFLPPSIDISLTVWEGLIRSIERATLDIPNGATVIPSLLKAILVTAVPFCNKDKVVTACKDAVNGIRFLQSNLEKGREGGQKQDGSPVFANPLNESLQLQARSSIRDLISFSEQLYEWSSKSEDIDTKHQFIRLLDSTSWSAITKLAVQTIIRAAKQISIDILSYTTATAENDNDDNEIEEDEEIADKGKSIGGGKSSLEDAEKKADAGAKTLSNSSSNLSASAKKRLKKKKKKTSTSIQATSTTSINRPTNPLQLLIPIYFALGLSTCRHGVADPKYLNFPLDLFFMDLIEDAIVALENGSIYCSNFEPLSSIIADLSLGWSQYSSIMIVSGCVVHTHNNISTTDMSSIFATSPISGSISKQLSLSETSFNASMFRLCLALKRMSNLDSSGDSQTHTLFDNMNDTLFYQDVFEKKNTNALLDVIFKPILHQNKAESALYELMKTEGGVEIRTIGETATQNMNSISSEDEGFLEDIPYYCNDGLLSEKDESWIESIAVQVEPEVRPVPVSPQRIASYTLIALAIIERLARFNDGVKAELVSRGFSRIYRYCIESVLLPIHLPSLVSGGTGPRPLLPSSEGKAAVTKNCLALKNVLIQWQKHERERGTSLIDEDTPSWLLHDLLTKDGAEAADGVRAIYWAAAVATVSGPLKYIRAKKLESLRSISHAVNGKNSRSSDDGKNLVPPHLSPPLPPSKKGGEMNGKAMAIRALGSSAMVPVESSPIIVTKQDLDRVARLELEKAVKDRDLSKLPDPLPIPIPEEEFIFTSTLN